VKAPLNYIDTGSVVALMLRMRQLSGRLNASSTITRSKDDLHVDANFEVSQGGFLLFKYDLLKGTVKYTGDTVALDARLQQNPTMWLEAKGTAPVALFNGTAAKSNEKVDLHVDSSPIDLGLAQGFTTALTNVKGTLEAHVTVTGTAADPNPDGTITVQNAAFRVEPTGVDYTDLDGRVELKPDRVHIDQIRILDNQGQTANPSAFDALQIDLHLTVPDDLVIKASDLRAPGAPLSLGALNITLGGDLWVTKVPWDQIRLVGPVRTIRGYYDFQGRR